LQAVHPRHHDVEKRQVPAALLKAAQGFGGRRCSAHFVAIFGQPAGKGLCDYGFVVNDKDASTAIDSDAARSEAVAPGCCCHEFVPPAGRTTANFAPRPNPASTSMRPPCRLMIPCASDKPNPVPLPAGLVVKNGSNR